MLLHLFQWPIVWRYLLFRCGEHLLLHLFQWHTVWRYLCLGVANICCCICFNDLLFGVICCLGVANICWRLWSYYKYDEGITNNDVRWLTFDTRERRRCINHSLAYRHLSTVYSESVKCQLYSDIVDFIPILIYIGF